jgi:hypothetical protein
MLARRCGCRCWNRCWHSPRRCHTPRAAGLADVFDAEDDDHAEKPSPAHSASSSSGAEPGPTLSRRAINGVVAGQHRRWVINSRPLAADKAPPGDRAHRTGALPEPRRTLWSHSEKPSRKSDAGTRVEGRPLWVVRAAGAFRRPRI